MLNRDHPPIRRVVREVRSIHVVLLTCLVGCGAARKPAVYPVVGSLMVGGQPTANAMIAFHPIHPAASSPTLPVATTGPGGTFRLTTHAAGDGAPVGEYAVTVVWPNNSEPWDECDDEGNHDQFQGRYADPARSPWRVVVVAGVNEVPLRAEPPVGDWSLSGQHAAPRN